ncbi:hypothetical protein PBY51_015097 [Eleginops maclovinus]|uniref:Uncharacterized protein n=1 Tax=Eleginops maclovinus TaxID=56733 RepID=A0AAN8A849_ELEMC|nr:hypothetical protein PBY51_015097 [Eleginops maclovinus]
MDNSSYCHMKDRVSRSPRAPSHSCTGSVVLSLGPRLLGSTQSSQRCGETGGGGGGVCACVFTPPHRSPQCLSQSWRVLLFECSPWRPCQWVLVPTSGLSGVRSP